MTEELEKQVSKKTIAVLIAILILMTCFGYIAGALSTNIVAFKQAQKECYQWIEMNCNRLGTEKNITLVNFSISMGGQQ